MKVEALKVGDRLENYRKGVVMVITRIAPCGSCACGNGEISFDELRWPVPPMKRGMTFRQFERLRFIRREGDRG